MGTPTWIVADTKYGSEECLRYLQDRSIKTSINPETKSNRPGYYSKKGIHLQKLMHIILEGLMGEVKNFHGMARPRFRGLKKVEIQFLMTASALNLKKMVKRLDTGTVKCGFTEKIFGVVQIGKDIFRNFIKELVIQAS